MIKQKLDIYNAHYQMILIRHFEQQVNKLFEAGLVHGTTHLCIGQEAVAVGVCQALKKEDYMTSTHRGHGHMLAKGASPYKMLAEIMGRENGYCAGRGGSQHIAWIEGNFLGCNGITGGGIPIATGAALHLKRNGQPFVSICFFGDGAVNQGSFHECLNMASIWKLPIVFICENNLYAMSMPVQRSTSGAQIVDKAIAYGMPGKVVEDNHVVSIYNATCEAVERARSGAGPTLIECRTYRWLGHSRGDPRHYRSRQEEAKWKEKDPIAIAKKLLIAQGTLQEDLEKQQKQVKHLISDAVEFALASPYPAR